MKNAEHPKTMTANASLMRPWTIYVLCCGDGTLYTGITNNLEKRLNAHQNGQGAKYTRTRLPVEICYLEEAVSRAAAARREVEIKKLSRTEKLALIAAFSTP